MPGQEFLIVLLRLFGRDVDQMSCKFENPYEENFDDALDALWNGVASGVSNLSPYCDDIVDSEEKIETLISLFVSDETKRTEVLTACRKAADDVEAMLRGDEV
jgi:hypothetical protein